MTNLERIKSFNVQQMGAFLNMIDLGNIFTIPILEHIASGKTDLELTDLKGCCKNDGR